MSRAQWAIALIGVAILGALGTIYATSLGAGLLADSQPYLEAARNLVRGKGIYVRTINGGLEPLTNWPPLLSGLLAALGLLGLDPRAAGRWLNLSLFVGTAVLGMLAVRHITRGSLGATLLGGILLITSLDLLTVYTQVGSEPLFTFFGLLGLILLGLHLERPSPYRLLGGALAIGLAFLSRYPGVAFIGTGIVALLWFDRRSWRHRGRDAVLFALVSGLPMLLWMIRNWRLAREPVGSARQLEFHPPTGSQLRLGLDTVWGWISPEGALAGRLARLSSFSGFRWIVLAGALAMIVVATRRWLNWRARTPGTEPLLAGPLLPLLALFGCFYLGFLVASMSFFDASIPLDRRLLAPLLPATTILLVGIGWRLAESFRGSPFGKSVIVAGCIGFAMIYADAARRWISQAHLNGLGYANKLWQQSDILRRVRDLPAGTLIYTNGPDVIPLVTDRIALELPRKVRANTGRSNPTFVSEVDEMVKRLRTGAVLVHLRRVTWRVNLYGSEVELVERLHLRLREAASDGAIYEISP